MLLYAAGALLCYCDSAAQKVNLSVADFEKGINQQHAQVLDVRTAGEYRSGHLAHALLADWTNKKEFTERTAALDRSKPVYAYCLSGARSAAAADWLNKRGFKAYNLDGGINAWRMQNKPMQAAQTVRQTTLDEYLASIPANKTVLVDFGAEWCPPCKKMEPVLQELQQLHGSAFTLLKIDGGAQAVLCKALAVTSFPTFIVYKNGKPVWRKEGVVALSELASQL